LFEQYLKTYEAFQQSVLDEMRREIEKEIEDAHTSARRSDFPDRKELLNYVFR
jgi:TPP-dependent pyruvate/acetoin dehydrogenase alpha subunit